MNDGERQAKMAELAECIYAKSASHILASNGRVTAWNEDALEREFDRLKRLAEFAAVTFCVPKDSYPSKEDG